MARQKPLPDGPRLMDGPLTLRPPQIHELPLYADWWSDRVVCYGFCSEPRSLEDLDRAFPEAEEDARAHGHWLELVIEWEKQPIGLIWLSRYDPAAGSCQMGILIGKRDFRLRGIGRRAVTLLAGWAFRVLGVDEIEMLVRDDLIPALRCYQAAGAVDHGVSDEVRVYRGEVIVFRRLLLTRPGNEQPAETADQAA